MPKDTVTADTGAAESNKVWYLRQNRIFGGALDADVERHAPLFKIVAYPRKAAILDLGDTERVVFFVKRGVVRIARLTEDGNEVTLALLGPGDLFGEEMLFASGPRTTVALALDDVLLCTARADDLLALMQTDAAMALNVAKTMNERLGDAHTMMEDVAYARIPDRIMHALQRIASEYGEPDPAGTRITIRLTHAELASIVASTRETVSLELSRLTARGLIAMDGRHIVVRSTTD